MYAPFAAQEGNGGMFDFFFSAAASETPCASSVGSNSNNTGIGHSGGEATSGFNAASAGPLMENNNGDEDKVGRLNFDFASFFFQGGQSGAYDDIGLDAAGRGGDGGGADSRGLEHYIQRGSADAAESTGKGVLPALGFFFPEDQVAPAAAGGSFIPPPASWYVESAAGAGNKYAPPQVQPQSAEAVREAVTMSKGKEAPHTVAQPSAALTVLRSDPTHIAPVDQTPVKRLPCEHASSSEIDHECSLAAALAAAPSSLGLLSDEESQRTAVPLSRISDAEEAKSDETSTSLVADNSCPEPEACDSSSAQGVAEEDAVPASTHSRQPPPRVPLASPPRSSHSTGAAPADAVFTPTPASPRKPPAPLTPSTSTPYRPEAPMLIGPTGSDATSVALRKAIGEAEEVWAHAVDMESITCPVARNGEMGMSSSGTTPSSSSDAVFFAEVAQLQQQTARLTEESARSATSLQALTSDLLRILGPHAALSSLAGEQYAGTPLVHLPWALIAVLEGLLNNDADAEERAEGQPVAPRPSSDGAEIDSSGDHDA
ncbi:conserved hypothetical protein [Leishmania mexicana MHOM/GT/2001/U1103]|uniref:Uncharacterized protein n=1 Tax=Leishmania mexicana (strain MHOM/GT/2001/U1103) TaxID=929439 RepID=E9B434_LEIMU|nr:conserved hypothetical protein [Leishmania mexicana MHOM/GT/2001/U1103]CBZ30002.1 conserved hypothetical protein [Leishmania mexicana MHOM/GT/2001/U1103]